MKRETLFLKAAVILIGSPVLAVCVAGLIWLPTHPAHPEFAPLLYPITAGIYVSMIPFFLALIQAFRLLGYIDRNQAFSLLSVGALKRIKICALSITGIYTAILPVIFLLAEKDDAPGLIIIGMVLVFASLVIAIFAAVLQQLLQVAVDIKAENDLVV